MTSLKPIDALTVKRRLDEGSAILIDIREADEYAREHVVGARLVPLSGFDRHDLDAEHGKAVVFHCRGGNRTAANAAQLLSKGFGEAYALTGGIEAWKAAGLPVHLDRRVPIDIARQAQIGAGSLVLLGLVLGALVSPWFFGVAAFVGCGLIFAGTTGFCGMARLLRHMPWNRGGAASA
jgi:rhodanese-related sulfurtransferase